jgi:hypothetical protein
MDLGAIATNFLSNTPVAGLAGLGAAQVLDQNKNDIK